METPCRCCLLRPPDKDLKTPYGRVGVGMPEVYLDMLEQCFDIHIILGGEGDGICDVCVGRLRDATDFKLQVQRSQEQLQARLAALLIKDEEAEVKSEADEIRTSDDVSRPEVISEKGNYGTSGDVIDEDPLMKSEGEDDRMSEDNASHGEPAVTSEASDDAAGDSGLPHAGPRTHTLRRTREPSACTDTASDIYQCDECGKGFGDKARLRKHVHTHLPGPSAYSNKRLETPSINPSATSLEDRGQADQMVHTGDKLFQCSYCNYKCKRKLNLKAHERIHTGEKPFQCSYCDYRCNQTSALKKHERIHTGEKPYKCSHCDYKCSQKSSLESHKKIHTGEKPFQCSYCDYKCIHKSHLECHKRIHTGEKPYKCSHCDYKCSHKSSLERHKRIHTGEKSYKCSHCDYKCSDKSNLENHKRIHTGEKPFHCSHCDYKCNRKSHLHIHKRIHTGENSHKCLHCSYATIYKYSLQRHLRTMHSGENPVLNKH